MCLPLTSEIFFFFFTFRMIYIAIAVRSCIVKVRNKAQFPACAGALLIELKELSGSLKQNQILRNICVSFCQKLPEVQLMLQLCSFICSFCKSS